MRFLATLAVLVLTARRLPAQTPEQWAAAGRAIPRLPPHAFPALPHEVRHALEQRECTVPQSYIDARPHNVIRGHFARATQVDWAVLCSRGDSSTVLIFWGGQPGAPMEMGRAADNGFLQTIGGNEIGYSRVITVADSATIRLYAESSGGPLPKRLDHDGLEDAFAEKYSAIFYLERGRWLSLAGAD